MRAKYIWNTCVIKDICPEYTFRNLQRLIEKANPVYKWTENLNTLRYTDGKQAYEKMSNNISYKGNSK